MSTVGLHNDLGLKDEDIAAVRQPLERASLLPPEAYTDARIFQLERERIFAHSWLPVCHTSQLKDSGSYVTRVLVGEPVIALRDREGQIKVMSNVCRHRNTTLASGCGTVKGNRIICPYHGWTYGLDGKFLCSATVFNIYPYTHAITDAATPLWLDFNIHSEREHELVWTLLLPAGAQASPDFPEKFEALKAFFVRILDEDIGVTTGVGLGVHSRFIRPGRLSQMEKTLHQFHNWWLDAMLGNTTREADAKWDDLA